MSQLQPHRKQPHRNRETLHAQERAQRPRSSSTSFCASLAAPQGARAPRGNVVVKGHYAQPARLASAVAFTNWMWQWLSSQVSPRTRRNPAQPCKIWHTPSLVQRFCLLYNLQATNTITRDETEFCAVLQKDVA